MPVLVPQEVSLTIKVMAILCIITNYLCIMVSLEVNECIIFSLGNV